MKQATKEVFLQIARYCSFRDRCYKEVREKLLRLGLQNARETALIIKQLEKEGYLDEMRFAKIFARGKFYSNRCGRVKIALHLKQKGLPEQLIDMGLEAIDVEDYLVCFDQLCQKKLEKLPENLSLAELRFKLRKYLYVKGYETDLIDIALQNHSLF